MKKVNLSKKLERLEHRLVGLEHRRDFLVMKVEMEKQRTIMKQDALTKSVSRTVRAIDEMNAEINDLKTVDKKEG